MRKFSKAFLPALMIAAMATNGFIPVEAAHWPLRQKQAAARDLGQASVAKSVMATSTPFVTSVWHTECRDAEGNLKWEDTSHNLVVTTGLNALLDNTFRASGYTAAWSVGLKGTGTVAAGDTMASHAGWSEITAYSESTRQTLTLAAASGGSATNSASKAVFNVNGSATVDGYFVTTSSTKSGTTGTLYNAVTFSGGSRAVTSGDILSVTVTLSVTG